MNEKRTIRRTFLREDTEEVTYEDFARMIIQDRDVAHDVVERMLAGDDPYQWNDDDSRYAESFEIIDRDGLREQAGLP